MKSACFSCKQGVGNTKGMWKKTEEFRDGFVDLVYDLWNHAIQMMEQRQNLGQDNGERIKVTCDKQVNDEPNVTIISKKATKHLLCGRYKI